MTMAATTATRKEPMPAITAAASASANVCGSESGQASRRARLAGDEDDGERRERGGQGPYHRRDEFGQIAGEASERGVRCACLDCLADGVRSKNHIKASTATGTRTITPRSAPRTLTPATVHDPLNAGGIVRAGVLRNGDLDGDGLGQAGDADGGDEHDHRGAILEAADDAHLHCRTEGEADHERDEKPEPERHVVLHDEQRQGTAPTTPMLPTAKLMIPWPGRRAPPRPR